MERISLPVRTVSRRPWVAAVAGAVLILIVGLWTADVLFLRLTTSWFAPWRTVVLMRSNLRSYQHTTAGEQLSEDRTLFTEGGVQVSLQPAAYRALLRNPWDGAMRYVYARGFWRDVTTWKRPTDAPAPPKGRETVSGLLRSEQIGGAVNFLQSAVRCEPMNAFYRQTLAEVLMAADPLADRSVPRRLIQNAPPRSSWGEKRTAELLGVFVEPKEPARDIREHYVRALDLVPADLASGIPLILPGPSGDAPPRPLGPAVVDCVTTALVRNFGRYSTGMWRDATDFKSLSPQVHALIAACLAEKGNPDSNTPEKGDPESAKLEQRLVVQSAEDIYKRESGFGTLRLLVEILDPFVRCDPARRFLAPEDLLLAASVRRTQNQFDAAIDLCRKAVGRYPGRVAVHVDLAAALIDRYFDLTDQAARLSDAHNAAQADTITAQARVLRSEAERELSIALGIDPKSSDALAVRGRLTSRPGVTAR